MRLLQNYKGYASMKAIFLCTTTNSSVMNSNITNGNHYYQVIAILLLLDTRQEKAQKMLNTIN